MNIRDWLLNATDDERKTLAEEAGTSVGYLWQLAGGHRNASAGLAIVLERITVKMTPDRVIWRHEVRPDFWEVPPPLHLEVEIESGKTPPGDEGIARLHKGRTA